MREGLHNSSQYSSTGRITPACAGRTHFQSKNLKQLQDHPRVCGKDCIPSLCHRRNLGSPPRVREGREKEPDVSEIYRITPACAGRTDLEELETKQSQDHPRVCGKDHLQTPSVMLCTGSPPRVREGRNWNGSRYAGYRITPACAGRTC